MKTENNRRYIGLIEAGNKTIKIIREDLENSLPQRLMLPTFRETHGIEIDGRIIRKRTKQFVTHVVLR